MPDANMRDRPMLDEIEITPEMVEAAASALYEDDWGMEVPKVTAERALRRALAVAPWVGRVPLHPHDAIQRRHHVAAAEAQQGHTEHSAPHHYTEDDGRGWHPAHVHRYDRARPCNNV